jgi:hypothetical protein
MGHETGKRSWMRLKLLLPVVWRLGVVNVIHVFLYRLALRFGLYQKRLPSGSGYRDPLFKQVSPGNLPRVPAGNAVVEQAEDQIRGWLVYFSRHKWKIGTPPDWFKNPLTNGRMTRQHWSTLGDFDSEVGDIKIIWEPSRFDWALVFARAFRQTDDKRFCLALTEWCSDWTENNPLNDGPNWKCGQETGIRMQQALLAAYLLRQHREPTEGLVRFVSEHCRRIEPTMRYALAQDNNHGTSEAAALFVGGAWLEKYSTDPMLRQNGSKWKNKGRKWLENRISRLVGEDGSFSQYSLNYHRLLLDTLNIVEFWRRELALQVFSHRFYERSRAALDWLYQMVDETSGDAPNLGPNDGARLFVLSDTDYRDFRPSVQLGAVLFMGGKIYPPGIWDHPLRWLSLDSVGGEKANLSKKGRQFADGGYVTFEDGKASWALLRYPVFRFRPAHADAFHFDLWHQGRNVLRDSGSYSYNTEEPWQSYFSSTKAHNTVEFDGKDQMPSISRFLRGCWLKTNYPMDLKKDGEMLSWSGTYTDYLNNKHERTVNKKNETWTIQDAIEGSGSSAILRWRLFPVAWKIVGDKCVSQIAEIRIASSIKIKRIDIVEGWESRYYSEKTPIPVLEVEIGGNKAIITSEIRLNQLIHEIHEVYIARSDN